MPLAFTQEDFLVAFIIMIVSGLICTDTLFQTERTNPSAEISFTSTITAHSFNQGQLNANIQLELQGRFNAQCSRRVCVQ